MFLSKSLYFFGHCAGKTDPQCIKYWEQSFQSDRDNFVIKMGIKMTFLILVEIVSEEDHVRQHAIVYVPIVVARYGSKRII